MRGREVLFVGDVQGCATELRDLLGAAGFDRHQHRLALCGDLIGRGPDSAGVLALARGPPVGVCPGVRPEGAVLGGLPA
jgi:hypothetical protein